MLSPVSLKIESRKGRNMNNQCPHKFTYTKDDLFHANSIFSKKKCELCGETIVMEGRSKLYIFLFILFLVIALVSIPTLLNNVFTDVSYMAKGMVAVLIFCVVYAFGILKFMNMATYKTYEPPKRVGEDVYEETKARTEARLNKLYGREKKTETDQDDGPRL